MQQTGHDSILIAAIICQKASHEIRVGDKRSVIVRIVFLVTVRVRRRFHGLIVPK
jgi:hypothetical protein